MASVVCNYHAYPEGLFFSSTPYPRVYHGYFDFEGRTIEIAAPVIVISPETEMYAKELTLTCQTIIHLGVLGADKITLNSNTGYISGKFGTLDGRPRFKVSSEQVIHTAQNVFEAYQNFIEQNQSHAYLITALECPCLNSSND